MHPFSTKSASFILLIISQLLVDSCALNLLSPNVPSVATTFPTVDISSGTSRTANIVSPAIIPSVVNIASSPSTIVKATETLCTRSQCYEKLASTVGNNIERVIMTETTNQVSYMNSVMSNKLSSAMGPAIAVAMKVGPISSKINKGEYISASGVVTEAVGMYYVGAQSFLFCSANTAFLGPYAVIPGFICAGIASAVAENTINDIKTSLYAPTHKPIPNFN